jgi:hypothetical protein
MKTTPSVTLLYALKESFSTRCKLLSTDADTRVVPIEVPLAAYNDENVLIFVEQTGDDVVIHDGGRLVDYLADHNILMPLKQKPYRSYFYFYEDLAQRHGFRFSKQHRRFEMSIAPTDGRDALIFAECLVALSFLVMTKSAGLKPFSFKDARKLSGLQMTLTAAFSAQIKVKYGLEPQIQQRRTPQDWGLTLRAPDESIQGCVHYLSGTDWPQLVRRALVFNSFSQMSGDWFKIEPDRYWGIYGGPPQFFEDTNAILANIGNGHSKRVLRLSDEESLISEITNKLGLSAQENWQYEARRQRDAAGEMLFAPEEDEIWLRGADDSRPEQLVIHKGLDSASIGDQRSIEMESAANRLLDDAEHDPQLVTKLLDTYGIAFAEYVLAEIKRHPSNVPSSRFTRIADALLQYYIDRKNVEATELVDRYVAEVETDAERLAKPEEAFREEEDAINHFIVGELRTLKREVARLADAKSGRYG